MDLLKIRDEIDRIDQQIVDLYEKRMECVKDVATYKIETGKAIFDRQREIEKIERVQELASEGYNKFAIKQLFEQIMTMSRKLQYDLVAGVNHSTEVGFDNVENIKMPQARVIFQGAIGAYSHMAMKRYFGEDIEGISVDTFYDAMLAIKEGKADFAILPIENSSAGNVNEVFDLIVQFDNYIVAQQIIKIEHYLLGVEGANIDDIEIVYAHPQSFMQSAQFLNEHPSWKCVNLKNNAFAAKKVKEDNNITQAAIASSLAGEYYGLNTIRIGINDNANNETRFIVISNKKICELNANKISICFELPNETGSLYKVLTHIIYNKLNMTKIESRPIAGEQWRYRFFVDLEGNLMDSAIKNALNLLNQEVINFKILGNYLSNEE